MATRVKLTTVTRTSGANRALKSGEIRPETVDLEFIEVPVLVHAFRRMVRQLEFDVCELAITTYLTAKSFGVRFSALPVFLWRGLHHGAIQTRSTAGISEPRQLEGRRVGVNRGYTVTTGVWARGILAEEHGVDLDRVTWVCSGDEHVLQYRPPANVTSAPTGSALAELLDDGDLAATIGADLEGPEVVPLIPDPDAAAMSALTRGFYPINHLVVVRDEVLHEHPGVAVELFEAFAEAKRRYVSGLKEADGDSLSGMDKLNHTIMAATGGADPLPYGIGPNRDILEKLLDHAASQRILSERPSLEDMFARNTLGLQA